MRWIKRQDPAKQKGSEGVRGGGAVGVGVDGGVQRQAALSCPANDWPPVTCLAWHSLA